MVEDSAADVMLLEHALRAGGIVARIRRVQSRDEFLTEIEQAPPDVILSDHGLAAFDGFAALEVALERCPAVPFIFVTGSSDQAMLVEMTDAGATDFVFKNRLTELAPAIERALRLRAENRAAPPAKPELETVVEPPLQGHSGFESGQPVAREGVVPVCATCLRVLSPSGQWEDLADYLQAHPQATIALARCPDCLPQFP